MLSKLVEGNGLLPPQIRIAGIATSERLLCTAIGVICRRKINLDQLSPGKITPAKPGTCHVAQGKGCVGKIARLQVGIVEFRVIEDGPFKSCVFKMSRCKADKVKNGPVEVGPRANGPPEPRVVKTGIFKIG